MANYVCMYGYVNKQNCSIWGTENPHTYSEKPTHPKRVTVWCGIWSRGIIGTFFFENEQREAVTEVPAEFFLFPKLEIPMKGKLFAMIEEMKEKSKQKKRFKDRKKYCHKCIISEGGYFEGDKIVIDK